MVFKNEYFKTYHTKYFKFLKFLLDKNFGNWSSFSALFPTFMHNIQNTLISYLSFPFFAFLIYLSLLPINPQNRASSVGHWRTPDVRHQYHRMSTVYYRKGPPRFSSKILSCSHHLAGRKNLIIFSSFGRHLFIIDIVVDVHPSTS